ncbi:MAG: class I SAM-dependent methyltransferase [Chitinophagaceae bacterium]|nr:class I SAM-dependent methyltransferase [Chitinophagaceae bacterium]
MNTQDAYNRWAESYDTIINKTRDLEQAAAKNSLVNTDFSKVIEIGCGTGKNTVWIAEKASALLAVDFSEEMMNIARQKINSTHVRFRQADITKAWNLDKATLITCSLVVEHIDNIDFIFEQVSTTLENGGCFYLCELHPYKQLQASRARFEYEGQLIQLEYFVHHISDFFAAARKNDLQCLQLREWFDDNDRNTVPRLVSFLFQK